MSLQGHQGPYNLEKAWKIFDLKKKISKNLKNSQNSAQTQGKLASFFMHSCQVKAWNCQYPSQQLPAPG